MVQTISDVLPIAATITGIIGSIAYFPQIYKIIKRKSVEDISIVTYSIWTLGTLVWLLYGIQIRNKPIIISNSIGLIGATAIITLYIKYKKNNH
ncbi:MAG: SemiSWEET family transporter [Nanoarchaeota archaeon]